MIGQGNFVYRIHPSVVQWAEGGENGNRPFSGTYCESQCCKTWAV